MFAKVLVVESIPEGYGKFHWILFKKEILVQQSIPDWRPRFTYDLLDFETGIDFDF